MIKEEKDFNEIARIEKAIREKYGPEAIENPKKHWNQEKERKYLKDLKKFYKEKRKQEVVEQAGQFTIRDKIQNKNRENTCPVCEKYSLSRDDDLYMFKFCCCFNCYIDHIEGRESRWKSGWRPKK